MNHDRQTERFIYYLSSVQEGLFAYILAMVGDADAASDVLQETSLVLWRKFDEYVEGTNFVGGPGRLRTTRSRHGSATPRVIGFFLTTPCWTRSPRKSNLWSIRSTIDRLH